MLRYGLYAVHSVIQVGRRGRELLIAALAAVLFRVGGNPVFAVGARKVNDDVRLGLGAVVAALMRTGEGNACVRICFFVGMLRVVCGNVLEVGGFLDELAVRAVLAHKLEILLVVLLDVIIHGVLFVALLVAVGTDKRAGFVADISGGNGGCRRSGDHWGNYWKLNGKDRRLGNLGMPTSRW